MKTVDRYIAKNFIHALVMCTLVMLAMRVLGDLFANMDEFSEVGGTLEYSWLELVGYVASFYLSRSLIYFQEMGGVVLVAAAMFSLVRMNHTNELIAVMAGGMSLYRVIAPLVAGAMIFAAMGAINQELLIPAYKQALARDHDEAPGTKIVGVELLGDDRGNIWFSRRYMQESGEMERPIIIPRGRTSRQQAKIYAAKAIETPSQGGWLLKGASMVVLDSSPQRGAMDSHLLRSYRWPEKLEAEKDNVDIADGLGISFEQAYGKSLLKGLKADVYSPEENPSQRRVIASMFADYAMYFSDGGDSGYILVGSPGITMGDILHYSILCSNILSGERLSSDNIFGALWASLDQQTQEIVRNCAKSNIPPDVTNSKILAASLDKAIRNGIFTGGEIAVPANNIAWLKPEMFAEISASGAERSELLALLNRAMLDNQCKKELSSCGGQLLIYSTLSGTEISLRDSGKWLDLMSTSRLGQLLKSGSAANPVDVSLTMHLRFTTPLSWVLMLLLGLPFVVSRDRKLKSSALMCLLLVGGFYAFTYAARYIGSDIYGFFDSGLRYYGLAGLARSWEPIFGAWLPIIIFVPVAVLMLESMHSMHAYDLNDTLGELLFSPGGRIRRRVFWRYFPPVVAIAFVAMLIDLIWIGRLSIIFATGFIATAWTILVLHFKRCHDRNRSGMFVLLPLLPLLMVYLISSTVESVFQFHLAGWMALGLFSALTVTLAAWVIAETWLLDGDRSVNAFGDDPKL